MVGWRPRPGVGWCGGVGGHVGGVQVNGGTVTELTRSPAAFTPTPGIAPASSLRRRQSADRLTMASQLVAEAGHPSRMAHVDGRERRLRAARSLEAAQRHLRAAEVLLRETR